MKNELAEKVRRNMVDLYAQALTEAWPQISTALDQAALNASMAGKDTLKFPVTGKATLQPAGEDCAVEVSVSFGTRARLTLEPVLVSTQPELPLRKAER
jgi:hypothetical protein